MRDISREQFYHLGGRSFLHIVPPISAEFGALSQNLLPLSARAYD